MNARIKNRVMLIGFDRDNTYLFSLFVAAFTLPNVLAQLIVLLRKRHPAPTLSFHCSVLLMNMGYAMIIYAYVIRGTYSGTQSTGYALLACGVVLILVPFDKWICPNWFEGNHVVYRELAKGVFDSDKFHPRQGQQSSSTKRKDNCFSGTLGNVHPNAPHH